MAKDIVEQIIKCETEAAAGIAETKRATEQMKQSAHSAGRVLLENTRKECEKKLSEYVAFLENEQKEAVEKSRIESLAQCEMMRSAADSKLEASALAVCERMTKTKWQ